MQMSPVYSFVITNPQPESITDMLELCDVVKSGINFKLFGFEFFKIFKLNLHKALHAILAIY